MSLSGPLRAGAFGVGLFGLSAVLLLGVGSQGGSEQRGAGQGSPSVGGALQDFSVEPGTLNRWTTGENVVRRIFNSVQDGLFGLDPDTIEPRPTLATAWDVSPDNLRYTFHLRKDVIFSDGTPFTSDDVAYTLRLIQDPAVASDLYKDDYKDVVKVETPDALTVVFHYKREHWLGINLLGFDLRVMSAKWVREKIEEIASRDREKWPVGSYGTEPGDKGFGRLYNEIREPSVGTGPYYFDPKRSHVKGQHLTLYRNPTSWWRQAYPGKWNLAALRWRFLSSDTAAWEELRKQNLDIKGVDHDLWYDSLSKDAAINRHFKFHQYDHLGLGHSLVYWNCRRPVLSDKRVRQALAHLVDRKTMLEVFNKNVGRIATCVFKPDAPEDSPDLKPRLKDLSRAKELLAKAGWKDTDGDGILDKEGKDLRFSILIPTGREEYRIFTQLWKEDMRKAGVDMEIQAQEWANFKNLFYGHQFDAACLYNSHTDAWPEPYDEYLSTRTGEGQPNHTGIQSEEIDRILEAARTQFDRGKRIELFHRFNEILYEEQPHLLLLHPLVSVVTHKRFRDVRVTRMGLNLEDWWVPPELRRYGDDGNPIRR